MKSNRSAMDAAGLAATLQRVADGDRTAFEEIYRRTSTKLFGVCLCILPHRQDAEEALQEAYLSVWRKAGSFDVSKGSAMTWLITLTRNHAVDRLRASGKATSAHMQLVVDLAQPDAVARGVVETGQDEQRLAYCIGTLDGGDAQLVRTAFFEGLTYSELATKLATPLGTIKSRIRRALLKLRDCLS